MKSTGPSARDRSGVDAQGHHQPDERSDAHGTVGVIAEVKDVVKETSFSEGQSLLGAGVSFSESQRQSDRHHLSALMEQKQPFLGDTRIVTW